MSVYYSVERQIDDGSWERHPWGDYETLGHAIEEIVRHGRTTTYCVGEWSVTQQECDRCWFISVETGGQNTAHRQARDYILEMFDRIVSVNGDHQKSYSILERRTA